MDRNDEIRCKALLELWCNYAEEEGAVFDPNGDLLYRYTHALLNRLGLPTAEEQERAMPTDLRLPTPDEAAQEVIAAYERASEQQTIRPYSAAREAARS